ncbi:SDR family NAD(P)-dependent oxidoreductase [uncultured Sphingomonas sp.]|uniref:SDR family NAD(P)-dependent oxidoreductase n=1 Tax=uncultured Sphingomonas sp. TaxID=158754 RepID=UPI0025F88FB1|nr:SDR family NAD(P)-dependent oxidoreductase [uncultured Sphingomonas sp.]
MHDAVVIGASGGIGVALVRRLEQSGRYGTVHTLSRSAGTIDLTDPASIAAAAERIGGPVSLAIVATGLLHEDGHRPERSLRELEADWLLRQYQVNTVGPALALRHFTPLLAKDAPATIACLSARVGSISDNRLGGWYGYRAAKAALNQIVKCAAIEIARTRKQAVCVALHPGTVETGLSAPFQGGVAAGKLFTPDHAAARLLAVLDGLTPAESGEIFAWDGERIAP